MGHTIYIIKTKIQAISTEDPYFTESLVLKFELKRETLRENMEKPSHIAAVTKT